MSPACKLSMRITRTPYSVIVQANSIGGVGGQSGRGGGGNLVGGGGGQSGRGGGGNLVGGGAIWLGGGQSGQGGGGLVRGTL